MHAGGSTLSPVTLHARKGILDMPRLEWCSGFGRLNKQRAHGKRHLGVVRSVFTTTFVAGIYPRIWFAFTQERRSHVVLPKIRLLERLFDVERRDGQRANHLKSEETDYVGGIVVGFEVDMGRQIEKLPESLGYIRRDFRPFSATVKLPGMNDLTDLCDRKTMLVDSLNNVGTPRASFALSHHRLPSVRA